MNFNRFVKPPNISLPEYIPLGSECALDILDRELQKGSNANILVYYDPDIDGLMAGLMVELHLQRFGVTPQYYLNENRSHGFLLSNAALSKLKGGVIIAVDFSISKQDYDRILQAGVNLINIDHHEINIKEYTSNDVPFIYSRCDNTYGIILNNQYKSEPSDFKFLSGAGMVYYFLKEMEKRYDLPIYPDFAAMVGITLLSDIREIENLPARSFLSHTFSLESDYMRFLKWLMQPEVSCNQRFLPFGEPNINRNFIDFTFSPVINALLRANRGDTAVNLLRGTDDVVRDMKSYDSLFRFRDMQKKIISEIMSKVKEAENTPGSLTRKLSKITVCCLTNEFESKTQQNITNYIGVACSKIKDEDKTGVIFVIDKDTNIVIRGSVRGGKDGVDYLSIFQSNGIPCAGHQTAFGILACDVTKIDFDKLDSDIALAESFFDKHQKNTRIVFDVYRMDIFMNSPESKLIRQINELSRDNHRVFVRYIGDYSKIISDKISDNFIKYCIDNVIVKCFDPSLDIKESFILLSFENSDYGSCTLRAGFDCDKPSSLTDLQSKLD